MRGKVNLAYAIARIAHKGQVDKAGVDYINHPLTVAENCKTEKEQIVALLHDVIEDTNVTKEDLMEFFDNEIVEAVLCLTHDGDSYTDYLEKISLNPLARNVKIQDIKHNMDLSRLSSPSSEDFRRNKTKYVPALSYLVGNNIDVKNAYYVLINSEEYYEYLNTSYSIYQCHVSGDEYLFSLADTIHDDVIDDGPILVVNKKTLEISHFTWTEVVFDMIENHKKRPKKVNFWFAKSSELDNLDMEELIKEYVEVFNKSFPIFMLMGTEDEEIKQIIKKCLVENKPYIIKTEKGVIY